MALLSQIGHRLICVVCRNPFRCWREDETHCGCFRHLKTEPLARA